jgi:dinuclear metal center YbgI/SA1388 family protein
VVDAAKLIFMVKLEKIVSYMDKALRHADFQDYPGAHNGLQVENSGNITRIAAAVDCHEAVLQAAVNARANLLIVHHGLFWGETVPWTGVHYRKMRLCLDNNLAVYSTHLPLDAHPVWGNNALLMKALGVRRSRPFFEAKGALIGRRAEVNWSVPELARRLRKATGVSPRVVCAVNPRVRKLGVVTGGAGNDIPQALAAGVDTFISGEANQHIYGLAHELGINLLLGGHYATETFGIKALAAHLSKKYRLPWTFLDFPTGL